MNPKRRSEETNPTPNPQELLPSDVAILAEIAACAEVDFSPLAARSEAHRQLTRCIPVHHQKPLARSKPLVRETGELSTRQLAAARLLVQGNRSDDVARRVGTIRQTINRWKKLRQFQIELRRMHELLLMKMR